jgi:hypothetical protein
MIDIFNRHCSVLVAGLVIVFVTLCVLIAYTNINHHYFQSMRHCVEHGGTWVMDFQNSSARICQVGNTQ